VMTGFPRYHELKAHILDYLYELHGVAS
jgi:hypothetical protein